MTLGRTVHAAVAAAAFAALLGSAACGKDPAPSPTLVANAGGPYVVRHTDDVTFSALRSTSTPNQIADYRWNCGQTAVPDCDKTGPTPTYRYRKCGIANRPACNRTNAQGEGIADYTVRLTIRDTQGNEATATTTVTVTNGY